MSGVGGVHGGMPCDSEGKINVYTCEPRKTVSDGEIGSPVTSSVTSTITSRSTTERETRDRNRLNYHEIDRKHASIHLLALVTDDELECALYHSIKVTRFFRRQKPFNLLNNIPYPPTALYLLTGTT